jgi:hypothetical protein
MKIFFDTILGVAMTVFPIIFFAMLYFFGRLYVFIVELASEYIVKIYHHDFKYVALVIFLAFCNYLGSRQIKVFQSKKGFI